MRHFRMLPVLFFMCVSMFSGTAFGSWKIMTEELPPYNFTRDSIVYGISADILLELMKNAGDSATRADIRMMPWPRAYNSVLNTPGSVLFSAARTEQREKLFKWVGPIADLRIGLIARKERGFKVDAVRDARNLKIGTIRDGAPEQLVVKAGIPESSLDRIADPVANIRKLQSGRIDLFAFNVTTTRYLMIELGIDPDDYETVYILKEAKLYYAFHKDTDESFIMSMNRALEELKRPDGEGQSFYRRTVDRYLSPEERQ